MTRPQGERIAILETKLDAVTKTQAEMASRQAAMDDKLDLILAGQKEAADERHEVREQLKAMAPDVKTIRDAKIIVKYGSWFAAGVGAVGASLAYAKGWIMLNWNWFLGR